ncbi:MAG: amidohydrolase [Planctomycetes bacterium]|nr:amidohydrolase [Planctomycetota bacterium]
MCALLALTLLLLALLGAPAAFASPRGAEATLLLVNGKVWTGNTGQPEAEAVAVLGDRVLAVGPAEDVRRLQGEGTRVVDLKGRRVVSGFIDGHLHFLGGGDELLAPDLRSARSEEDLAARLGEAARRLPRGTWITSGAWDHESWPGTRLPRREALDRQTPDHPVLVSRLDGHMAVANSLALRIAGVTRETPDPPGGEIVRDPATGEPAGVLKDAAMDLVSRHVPPWDARARRERALAALRHAASLGVTCVHDMGTTAEALATYQDLRRRGELTVRLRAYAPLSSLERWRELGIEGGFGDDALRVSGLKGFADGSLGSSTALFFEPYLDSPGTSGLPQIDLASGGELERKARAAAEARLQLAVHGIGDRAIRSVLDVFERTLAAAGPGAGALRGRVEHAQHIHPQDLPRFAKLGVVASMQPYQAADDGRWAEKRIGKARCDTTYAFRDLLESGARLAFGSDWPVAPLSPLLGIHAAVTRRTLDGKNPGGWVPRQKISVEEALRAYTSGAAYAAFDEERLGAIRPGWLADIAVLSEDLLAVASERIDEVKVVLTVAGGRVVFEGP